MPTTARAARNSTTSSDRPAARPRPRAAAHFGTSALVGLGGLFAGVTGPLLSAFIPVLVQQSLGDARSAIGAVMAIDNVLLLLLVPWAGARSDRDAARGRGRGGLAVGGMLLAAAGMAAFPYAPALALPGIVAALLVLYAGINIQRSPMQALVADLVPSRHRSLASASIMFQMCVGAIVFLMVGRALGMTRAFLVASATVAVIAAVVGWGLREPAPAAGTAVDATSRSLRQALVAALTGRWPGLRAIFVATLLLQLTFQTFTTWFALHGTERFGVPPEDVTLGFIAWALGGVAGALPAGAIGVRFGRRRTMLVGFGAMACALLALDRAASLTAALPLIALASASWTLPAVNAYPLFVEPVPAAQRGVLSSLFLLCMALGGALGDPLNGHLFDLAGSYRGLFTVMAAYAGLAAVAVLCVPRGSGEFSDPRPGGTRVAPLPIRP